MTDTVSQDGQTSNLPDADGETAHLRRALESTRTIGAAVGILMATGKVTYDIAFERLCRASQNANMKVRDLADQVLLTGSLPDTPRRGTRVDGNGPPRPAAGDDS